MQITQNEATAAERRIPFLAVRAQANSVIDLNFNDIATAEVASPGAPTVTPQGTAGATAYSYKIVARNANGETLASTAGSTSTGNATLDGTNFNRVSWTAVTGAATYDVYRSASAGTPATTGKIVSATASTTADDTGLAASGSEPASNTTADQFTLTWSGQTTATVKYTADFSAALQAAIEALSNFDSGDVEVDLQSGVIYRIYVGGQWVSQSIALPTVTPTGFTMGAITGGVADSAVTGVAFAAADLEVSKTGGAFAASTGTIAEVGRGIYYYQAAAGDVDTLGPLVATNVKLGLSIYPPSAQVVAAATAATVLHSGLAQAGASGTITLASGASATSDFYVPCQVNIVAGTGAGQGGRIGNAYSGTTKVLNVTPPWVTIPDATSEYELVPIAAVPVADIVSEVRGETDAALEAYDPPTNAEFEARSIVSANYATAAGITDIQGRLPAALVSGRMSSDAVAVGGSTTAASKLVSHAAGVLQVVIGAGSSGTSIVLNATTGINGGAPSATNDVYNGRVLVMTSGACAGQAKAITDYVGATVTLTTESFTTSPSAADTGVIV